MFTKCSNLALSATQYRMCRAVDPASQKYHIVRRRSSVAKMSIRPILFIPDTRLKQVVAPVAEITDEVRQQVKDMFDTMYDAPGIGLAAPQIGVMNRVVVVDCAIRAEELGEGAAHDGADDDNSAEKLVAETPDPIALINPEITWFSDDLRVHEEGCLSIPDYYEEVERPDRIRVRYMDVEGQMIEREADGILSTCIQHEVDHLNGKLFIDYLSRLKRERITKKFEKMAKRAAG